mgnify:CR=1 FL=1
MNLDVNLKLDDETEEIYYLDPNDDKIICPNAEFSTSVCSEIISEQIPNFPFDIEQGGNIRKSLEVETIYEVTIMNNILNNEFKVDIDKILDDKYNFKDLKSDKINGGNFDFLLEEIQSL